MSVRDMKLKEFVDSYHRPLDEEMAELRRRNESEGVPLILTETEGFLRMLLQIRRPRRILELGTAHGYSALFFARCLPDARITTIDRNPYMIEAARGTFASHPEGSRIDFRTGDAVSQLQILQSELASEEGSGRFDFVFIDAGKSHYREFFDISEQICSNDAVIVCDNILMKGWIIEGEGSAARRHRTSIKYMKRFLDYIYSRNDLDVTLLSGGDGLAIIRFKNDREQ